MTNIKKTKGGDVCPVSVLKNLTTIPASKYPEPVRWTARSYMFAEPFYHIVELWQNMSKIAFTIDYLCALDYNKTTLHIQYTLSTRLHIPGECN